MPSAIPQHKGVDACVFFLRSVSVSNLPFERCEKCVV